MEKIIEVGSWPRLSESCVEIVKVSSRGLIGKDRKDFLEKRAAHTSFVDAVDSGRLKLAKGDLPIHILAVGATEYYGPNRNGDGFCEETCKQRHHTFAKHARYYRHHKNKPENGDPWYGVVKLSAYNPEMHRIECLTIANMDKEAAERNGGQPMPPETLAKIERGEDVAWSMSCRLPFDVCANCQNKAASRDEYCDSDTCISSDGKRMFGCRSGLTKVADDGSIQYVENPGCTFFDLSEVIRPADRNCYGWKADYLQKEASDSRVLGGAELAELWSLENGRWRDLSEGSRRSALLLKLASLERQLRRGALPHADLRSLAFLPQLAPKNFIKDMPKSAAASALLYALTSQRALLPLREFVKVATKWAASEDVVQRAEQRLPGVFSRMANSEETVPTFSLDGPVYLSLKRWAEKQAAWYGLGQQHVQQRLQRAALRRLSPQLRKEAAASDDTAAERLARRYAAYELAFLTTHANSPDFDALCESVVLQNHVG